MDIGVCCTCDTLRSQVWSPVSWIKQKFRNIRGTDGQKFWTNVFCVKHVFNLKGITRSVINEEKLPVCGTSPDTMIPSRNKPCDAARKK